MAGSIFTMFAAALLAASPAALAQQLPPPNGRYEGRIALKDGNILAVTLGLGTKYDGKPGSDLRFDEPWACALELRPPNTTAVTTSNATGGSATETVVTYAFTGYAAGRCTALMPGGYMRVKPAEQGGSYSVDLVRGGATQYSVTLRAPATRPAAGAPASGSPGANQPAPSPPAPASPAPGQPASGGPEAKPN